MPSVYLRQQIKEVDRAGFVKGRVSEALRIAEKSARKQRVLPYTWFKYQDHRDNFVSKVSFSFGRSFPDEALLKLYPYRKLRIYSVQKDTESTINTIAVGADGLIIWGSSEDTDTEQKCKDLQRHVSEILGPAIKRLVK